MLLQTQIKKSIKIGNALEVFLKPIELEISNTQGYKKSILD